MNQCWLMMAVQVLTTLCTNMGLLLLISILMMIVCYLFAVVGFLVFRDYFIYEVLVLSLCYLYSQRLLQKHLNTS